MNTEMTSMTNQEFEELTQHGQNLYRICTSLQLCDNVIMDKQKIEKTLSTFHPNTVQSARNYRQDGYTEYAALIDTMQVAEA